MELLLLHLLHLLLLCVLVTAADGNSPVRIPVKEDSDVVLPCSPNPKENLELKLIDWKIDAENEGGKRVFMYDAGPFSGRDFEDQDEQFKGRVSHFQPELKKGNASIKITKTKVSDSGTYTCIFPRLQPSQTFSVQLVVECVLKDRTGENPGACPRPSAKPIVDTKDWSLLQCEVYGASPKPVVEWRDSSNNTLQSKKPQVTGGGGKYDIILQTTVTKTDNYTCVVTQNEICHQVESRVSVYISGAASKPYVTSRQTENGLLLQCEVHGASSGTKVEWKDGSGTISAEKPEFTQTGSSYDIILQTTVTKADTYTCEVTTETGQKYHSENYMNPKGFSVGWIVAGILLLVVLVVVVLVATGRLKLKCNKDEEKGKTPEDPSNSELLQQSGSR